MSWLGLAILAIVGAGTAALTVYTAINRRNEGAYLCDDCKFNDPESCLKPERPKALLCTSYRKKQKDQGAPPE
jgi:hypothetical protein